MFSSLDTVVCPNWFFVAKVVVAMVYFSSIVRGFSPPLICNNQKECVFIIGSTHHTYRCATYCFYSPKFLFISSILHYCSTVREVILFMVMTKAPT